MEKSTDTICFMVEINQCCMEAVEPLTMWIQMMGYPFNVDLVVIYIDEMLSNVIDKIDERFGAYAKK